MLFDYADANVWPQADRCNIFDEKISSDANNR